MIPSVELEKESINASSAQDPDNSALDPEHFFSENAEGIQLISSSRLKSNTNVNRIIETHGNITIQAGDLSVSEKNFDRQTHTHHSGI